MKPITHVAMILDQSGSMCDTRSAAVKNYNEQIQQAKLNSKEQDIFCSLVTFNGEVFEHVWAESPEKMNEANEADYVTEGATAMRDAIGYTVKRLLETTDSKNENVSYLVVIISDGEENSSKHFKALNEYDIRAGKTDELKALLQEVQATKRWTFTYMGCDERYIKKVSEETSIPLANCAAWSNATPAMAARGLHHNRNKLNEFYACRSSGESGSANVYSPDSLKCADFTEDIIDSALPDAIKLTVPPGGPTAINLTGLWAPPNVLNGPNTFGIVDSVNPINVVATNTGSATPFSNRSPVSWKQ